MAGRCDCKRGPGDHHHGWGGVYPCEGDELCIQCQPIEVRVATIPRSAATAINATGEDEAVLPSTGG